MLGMGVWVYLFAGLLLVIPYIIPNSLMFTIKSFGVTPNLISLKGLIVGWLGIGALAIDWYEVGFLLLACSFSLDIADGLFARTFPLDARLSGQWFDPLCDKLKIIPLFCFLVWKDILIWWLVAPVVILEVYGILSRPPFSRLTGKLDGSKKIYVASTAWGKAKHHTQVIAFGCAYVVLADLSNALILWQTGTNFLVLASVILGVRSILSRRTCSLPDNEC